MNILYLIGNGFDLAQGLKTSYQDFYQYLETQTPINSVAELMMKEIKGPETELWKDMELGLGKLTEKVQDKELFEEFYYDLCEKLRTYLTAQTESYNPSQEIKDKYIRDLVRPDAYLNEREKVEYRNFFNLFSDKRIVNIASFNYTDVLDKTIDANNSDQPLPSFSIHYFLQPISNVHGRLNTSYLLMGVDDETQILNPSFAKDEDVWDYLVKPQSNFEIGTLVDSRVVNTIQESNLIVAMGLSFGETDSNWWEAIGSRLRTGGKIRIILFLYIKDLPEDPRKQQPISRVKRKDFLRRCGIDENEYSKYIDNIYVCLNKGLFSPNTLIYNDDRRGI